MTKTAASSSSCYRLHGFFFTAIITVATMTLVRSGCDAFSFPRFPLTPQSCNYNIQGGGRGDGGGGRIRRKKSRHFNDGDGNDSGDIISFNLASLSWMASSSDESNCDSSIGTGREEVSADKETTERTDTIRGVGGISAKESLGMKSNGDNKKSIGASVNDTLDSLQAMLFGPFRMAGSSLSKLLANPFQKHEEDQSEKSKLKQQQSLLSSTTVQSVSAPGSDILPPDAVTQCAIESNLIGGTLTPETLELTANMVNRKYLENGYVMNSVTGATLVPSSDGMENDGEGHVELKVREVRLANARDRNACPIHIRFVENINDEDTGDDNSVISLPSRSSSDQSQSDHQHFKTVSGRTRPSKIARMTNLVPGSHFCIIPERWSQLATFPGKGFGAGGRQGKSTIFSTIHAVRPVPTSQENTVELEIIATENKPYVSIEYGVTKSFYSDQWEGELDLKHANVFGGGEVATVNVRKGKRSGGKEESGFKKWNKGVAGGPLSWRMSIKDDDLGGSDAGYDLEVFRDHVGVSGNRGKSQSIANDQREEKSQGAATELADDANEEGFSLRTGASMGLRLPVTKFNGHSVPLPKALSAKFERVDPLAKNDRAQCMTSMSTEIGPYHHSCKVSSRPLRSTLSATATGGGRWNARGSTDEGDDDTNTLPYATGTITTQQILPLSRSSPSTDLAMRYVASVSSRHLPRHEAILLGLSSRIRGYKYNYQQPHVKYQPKKTQKKQEQQSLLQSLKKLVEGDMGDQIRPPIALSKSISGTVELRIPLLPSILDSGTVILFGDCNLAQAQPPSSSLLSERNTSMDEKPFRHSSMGIGLRKVVQGLPLKVDACITEHGTKGLFFGMGA